MLCLIDNYDSFTYNLAHYFRELGVEVVVYRNDQITVSDLAYQQPQYIVISPGPGRPEAAGISLTVIEHFAGKVPILGVCLGHQSIVQYYGGCIVQARQVMHGKLSLVYHRNEGVFAHLSNPLRATRYHSLIAESETLPECLLVTAWTEGEQTEIMGVKHRELAVEGIQFHPESILTEQGHLLLQNFLRYNPSYC